MFRTTFAAIVILIFAPHLQAAGPESIGLSDRSLWPENITTPEAFDRASRAEIVVFAAALAKVANQDSEALKTQLHIKQVNQESVKRIQAQLFVKLLKAWQAAAASCKPADLLCEKISGENELIKYSLTAVNKLPAAYQAWLVNAQLFHEKYAGELIRLAALFPTITSEIDTFSPIELTGSELPDRHFLLTFDDGPTAPKGTTDNLLSILDDLGLHGQFYMLGENLTIRLKQEGKGLLVNRYKNHCVSLHGWQHQSHAKIADWQASIANTQTLVKNTFSSQYRPWFRPPYGQRLASSGDFFKVNNLSVGLWNIDSQDWNSHITGPEAAQRVFTLMLLWRRGVILFHDTHAKAAVAVPWLATHTSNTATVWKDCREY